MEQSKNEGKCPKSGGILKNETEPSENYPESARSFRANALYKDKKCSILSWVYLDKDRILAAFKFSCLFISSLRSSVSVWSWSDFWRSSASLFWRVLKPWISEIVLQRQGQLPLLKFSHVHVPCTGSRGKSSEGYIKLSEKQNHVTIFTWSQLYKRKKTLFKRINCYPADKW